MQTKLRSDAFLQQAMDTCGDAVYRLALCRLNSRADAQRTSIRKSFSGCCGTTPISATPST